MAREHVHMRGGDFDFWPVTGTPMTNSMKDLTTAMSLLQRPEWDDGNHPQHSSRVASLEELDEKLQEAKSATASPKDVAAFRAKATDFFRGGFVTRYTEESKFFGKPIFNLQGGRASVISPLHAVAVRRRRADGGRRSQVCRGGGNGRQLGRGHLVHLDVQSTA